jgi:hypothetical protein
LLSPSELIAYLGDSTAQVFNDFLSPLFFHRVQRRRTTAA